jgi:hypothetical protein
MYFQTIDSPLPKMNATTACATMNRTIGESFSRPLFLAAVPGNQPQTSHLGGLPEKDWIDLQFPQATFTSGILPRTHNYAANSIRSTMLGNYGEEGRDVEQSVLYGNEFHGWW